MKKNIISGLLLNFIFWGILIFLFFDNCSKFYEQVKVTINDSTNIQEIQKGFLKIEENLKSEFRYHEEATEIFGLGLVTLNKNIVGNFEFIKDEDGYMQKFESPIDSTGFQKSMAELKEAYDVPILFVNLPASATEENIPIYNEYSFFNSERNDFVSSLSEKGIDVINPSDYGDKYYFRTDVHPTTIAEFNTARDICNYLVEHGINMQDADFVFDLSNYDIEQYGFIGNLASNVGTHYIGQDIFDIYYPRFDTSYELTNWETGLHRAGTWKEVLINDYSSITDDVHNYYVINYGQWPSPVYSIINKNTSSDANILFLTDSSAMRNFSYLSLCCKKITIVDTRYAKEQNYVMSQLLTGEYDAVVVCGGESLISTEFASKPIESADLAQLSIKSFASLENGCQGYYNMWLDYCNGNLVNNQGEIEINQADRWISFAGWAIDSAAQGSLSSIYLQAGDNILKCEYGGDRQSVVDYFGEQYRYSNFTIQFDAGLLYDCNGQLLDSIQFVLVGADGTYMYEPVQYKLK